MQRCMWYFASCGEKGRRVRGAGHIWWHGCPLHILIPAQQLHQSCCKECSQGRKCPIAYAIQQASHQPHGATQPLNVTKQLSSGTFSFGVKDPLQGFMRAEHETFI
jgi:hypothetical protein